MTATVLFLTSYVLLVVHVLNVNGSVRRGSTSEEQACESQIEETCLLEHVNLYPSYSAFLASKTLKEHCGLIKNIVPCVYEVLGNTTGECGKLSILQQMEFGDSLDNAQTEHERVCGTATPDDGSCVPRILDSCFQPYMRLHGPTSNPHGIPKLLFSSTLEDHCRFVNDSLVCAFEKLHSTDGPCRYMSEESKKKYTNNIRIWMLFAFEICGADFEMFNETYDCIGRNFDSFDSMRTSCLAHQPRLDITFDSRCDRFLQNRDCTGLSVENYCGESKAGWKEFIKRFEETSTALKANNCRKLAVNKHACESQIGETCLREHLNLSPSRYNYLASKTLTEHCGLIEKIVSCADDVLENTTSECAKLTLPQRMEFDYLFTNVRTVHKRVCETGFTEFNAAYDCLVYKLKNEAQLWNLIISCLPDWNDEVTRMNFCDNFEIFQTCLQNSSAAICGEEVGETVNEFIEDMYNNYAVEIWGTAYDCSNSSGKRSYRHLLNQKTRN